MQYKFDPIDILNCYLAFLGYRPGSHLLRSQSKINCCKACDLMKLYRNNGKLMTSNYWEALIKKAYHPSKLTDKELAQIRRSIKTGSKLLAKIVQEQLRRGLLKIESNKHGYPAEIKKNISDY